MSSISIVVKVGGSLYDLPDLGGRLRRFLAPLPCPSVLIVPGGGEIADVVRALDRRHQLGETVSHWLALQALRLNAQFLSVLLGECAVVGDVHEGSGLRWRILDAYSFALADEGRPGSLPHEWNVTSDSIAARAAQVAGARQLILLKSIALPEHLDWNEAARRGIVDPYFPEAIGVNLDVHVVNFRVPSM